METIKSLIRGVRWGSIKWIKELNQIGLLEFQIWLNPTFSQELGANFSNSGSNNSIKHLFDLIPLKTILTTPDPMAWGHVWSAGPMQLFEHWKPLQPFDIGLMILLELEFWLWLGTKAPKFKIKTLATFMSWQSNNCMIAGQMGSGWRAKILDIIVIWASGLMFSKWWVWMRPLLKEVGKSEVIVPLNPFSGNIDLPHKM